MRPIVRQILMLAPALLAALAIYANTLDADFVYDDREQIVANPWVRSLEHLPRLLIEPVWGFRTTEPTNYYRPIQMVLYNLLWVATGGSPSAFHLANVVLHLLVIGVAGLLIHRASGNRYVAAAAALVFVAHPINTEVVAWVACVPELTFAMFTLAALWLHAISAVSERPWRDRRRWLALAAGVAALFSKETGAMLVPLVFVLEWSVGPASRRGGFRAPGRFIAAIAAALPYAAAIPIYAAARIAAVGSVAPSARADLTALDALINAPILLLSYGRTLLVPVHLNAFHIFEPSRSIADPAFVFAAVLTIALAALGAAVIRRRPDLAIGLGLLVFPLLPVLYLPALGSNVFSERYAYLPSLGAAWLLVAAVEAIGRRLGDWRSGRVAVTTACLVALPLGIAAARRNQVWQNDETLTRATLAREPRATYMYLVRSGWFARNGQTDEALATLEQGLLAVPGDVPLTAEWLNRRLQAGRISPDEAIAGFSRLDLNIQGMYELQAVLGDAYLHARRFDEAEACFRRAIASNPHDGLLYNRLAVVLAETARLKEARDALEQALRLDPGLAVARQNLERLTAGTAEAPK